MSESYRQAVEGYAEWINFSADALYHHDPIAHANYKRGMEQKAQAALQRGMASCSTLHKVCRSVLHERLDRYYLPILQLQGNAGETEKAVIKGAALAANVFCVLLRAAIHAPEYFGVNRAKFFVVNEKADETTVRAAWSRNRAHAHIQMILGLSARSGGLIEWGPLADPNGEETELLRIKSHCEWARQIVTSKMYKGPGQWKMVAFNVHPTPIPDEFIPPFSTRETALLGRYKV